MKHILLLGSFLIPALCFGQHRVFTDTIHLTDLNQQVSSGINRYHRRFINNDLYNFNVNKKPVYSSPDSIVYRVKFITKENHDLLWDSRVVFSKQGENLVIQISEVKMVKRTAFMSSPEYINVSLDDMEDTKGNELNLMGIKQQIGIFFKCFHK